MKKSEIEALTDRLNNERVRYILAIEAEDDPEAVGISCNLTGIRKELDNRIIILILFNWLIDVIDTDKVLREIAADILIDKLSDDQDDNNSE